MRCKDTAHLLGGPFSGGTVECTLDEDHADEHRGPVPGAPPGTLFLWPRHGDGPPTVIEL